MAHKNNKKVIVNDEINDIIQFLENLPVYDDIRKVRGERLTEKQIAQGLMISTMATAKQKEVAATPWFKQLLLKTGMKERLLNSDPYSKAEQELDAFVDRMFVKYHGVRDVHNVVKDVNNLKYPQPTTVDLLDSSYYTIDCLRNVRPWRQNKPEEDQNIQIQEKLSAFYQPTTKSMQQIIKMLKTDNNFRQAVSFTLRMMPYFSSTKEVVEINAHFQNKKTNVGAPYFRNDAAVDKATGKTFAQITLDIARTIKSVDQLYPYAMELKRTKFMSERPVIATSRVANLYFNRVLGPAIEKYSQMCPFMRTYQGELAIKDLLMNMYIKKPNNYTYDNADFTAFDTTISVGLKALAMAMLSTRINDISGREILYDMAQYYCNPLYLLNGIDNRVDVIYPHMYSGELGTNFFENIINTLTDIYSNLTLDNSHEYITNFNRVLNSATPILTMGDDINALVRIALSNTNSKSVLLKEKFGLKLYPMENDKGKGERGLFVLQHRLFRPTTIMTNKSDNEPITATPWTRVLQSLMVKENPVGIGYFGWCMSAFQAFDRLKNLPNIRDEIIKFIAELDKDKLGAGLTPQQFKDGLRAEDSSARSKGLKTSSERLYDGDPNKIHQYKQADLTKTMSPSSVQWSADFIENMLNLVKRALNPGSTNS